MITKKIIRSILSSWKSPRTGFNVSGESEGKLDLTLHRLRLLRFKSTSFGEDLEVLGPNATSIDNRPGIEKAAGNVMDLAIIPSPNNKTQVVSKCF